MKVISNGSGGNLNNGVGWGSGVGCGTGNGRGGYLYSFRECIGRDDQYASGCGIGGGEAIGEEFDDTLLPRSQVKGGSACGTGDGKGRGEGEK